jgi:hypothetical protein
MRRNLDDVAVDVTENIVDGLRLNPLTWFNAIFRMVFLLLRGIVNIVGGREG